MRQLILKLKHMSRNLMIFTYEHASKRLGNFGCSYLGLIVGHFSRARTEMLLNGDAPRTTYAGASAARSWADKGAAAILVVICE